MTFGQVRKTVAAVVGGGITWAWTALADGHVTSLEWVSLAAVVSAAFGVYGVANDRKPAKATTKRRR